MDNEVKIGEQPENEQVQENVKEEGTTTSENGSSFGKFSSAESLLSAYNNLQAEFTRKCQKLSELEKKVDNVKEEQIEEKVTPTYENEDWNRKVATFLENNEEAKNFSKEICDEIVNSPELSLKSDALELAWAKIKAEKYKAPEDMVKDNEFVENFILSNDEIKKKVLDIYIRQISENKAPPTISSSVKGAINLSPKSSPKSLDDARRIVEQLLKV